MILALIVGLAGMLLGVLYYGGLWLTVKRMVKTEQAPVLLALSFFIRMLITLVGFYFLMGGSWQRLLFAFLGFMLARVLLSNWLGKNRAPAKPSLQGVNHET